MQVEVIKTIEYRGAKVYARRIDELFEYLVVYKKELYSRYYIFTPSLHRRFLKQKYSVRQIDAIMSIVLQSAKNTVDYLLDGALPTELDNTSDLIQQSKKQ